MRKRHRRHHDHRRVNQPRPVHRHKHIHQLKLQKLPPPRASRAICGAARHLLQPRLHQRRVQIDHMRHHRRAQHPHRKVDALVQARRTRRIQRRHQRVKRRQPPVRMHQEHLEPIAQPDHADERHDPALQPPIPRQIQRQNHKHRHRRRPAPPASSVPVRDHPCASSAGPNSR